MAEARRVLITGASSGIGRHAARRMEQEGHRLTLICRNHQRAAETLDWIGPTTRVLEADLADLEQVDTLCATLLQEQEPIDALVLNAGLQYAGHRQPRWSRQGIELTLAVNHLAHQLMLMKLLPLLLQADEPRVVITASEVHNPTSGGGRVGSPAGLGDLAGLRSGAGSAMVDGKERFDADKAYKDSKLCNLLMGQELARNQPRLPVIAWSPGLVIPRSQDGFFRESRRANPLGQTLFGVVARDLLRLTESIENAGDLLTRLVLQLNAQQGFQYWSNSLTRPGQHRFEPTAPSAEACDPETATELWRLSDHLIATALADQC